MLLGYPKEFTDPIREEVKSMGLKELITKQDVQELLGTDESTLILINSVCGCAAKNARPGVSLALKHTKLPKHVTTAFAGVDKEAVNEVRAHITEYPPSSPSIALFNNKKLVYMMQRQDIEGSSAQDIANNLMKAFDEFL